MDRDDSALAIITTDLAEETGTRPRGPVPFEIAWRKLPPAARTDVVSKTRLMREIAAAKKIMPACVAISRRMHSQRGYSAERLSNLYYKWREDGAAALIDHHKCLGCGVKGCGQARKATLPDALIRRFRGDCGTNGKQGLTESWQRIIRDLCAGKILQKGLTWETLHRDLFPGLVIPAKCPWSLTNPPRGWSLSSFLRHKPGKALLVTMKHGMAAAWNHTPDVRVDMTKLRFLERVYFDDHKLDFYVLVWDAKGRVQIVELWGLFALDAATGECIAFGLRPKILRPDGTSEGLTMRDMQHLIADILARYGYPTAYTMTLVVENAAAAVSAYLEELLKMLTNGQVIVQRTGTHKDDLFMEGFAERWGAPRGKAPLESWFHALDIVLGFVKGQSGSNWTVRPGELDGRLKAARAMAAVMTAHPQLAAKLSAPLHWAGEIRPIVWEAIRELNRRTDHDLQRHDVIMEFRWSASDPTPKPIALQAGLPADVEREVKEYLALPPAVQEKLIAHGGPGRRESPEEKRRRIAHLGRFTGLSEAALFDLLMDIAKATYRGADVLDVELKRARQKHIYRFEGEDGSMASVQHGEEITVRWNSDQPEAGAWAFTARGQFITYLVYDLDPEAGNPDHLERLQRRLGKKIKAKGELMTSARKLKSSGFPQIEAALDNDIEVLATLVDAATPATTAPALPESSDLVRTVMRTKRPKAERVVSDAEAYLELLNKESPEPEPDTCYFPTA
ncbi:MAG: hypothetical protein ACO1TE_27080 [Prosthecobacter sp.]